MKYLVILISLQLIAAKISIDIKTGINTSDISVVYSGIDVKVVSDHEIRLFDINDRSLKGALNKHYGRTPNDAFLKSPTSWGDLYQKYNWEQVSRVLIIKSARVKGITKKPMIVMSQDFVNVFNNTIKVNAAISQTVENTIATSWTKNKEIAVSQEIEYDVNVVFAKITATTGFSYSSSWGESEEKSESVTIGTTSGVETELQPGQAATAVLTATKGSLKIEVTYLAKLRGNVAVNFKKLYNGHHFYGPHIGKVMKSSEKPNEITSTQIIKLGFYSDASLKVYDKVTKEVL